MLDKPIKQLTKDDIELLIKDKVPEDRTLEYKSGHSINHAEDKSRFEYRKDISAFANTIGGRIVYGIKEKKGEPTELTPIDIANFDALKRELEQQAQQLEPKLHGCEYHQIEIEGGKSILVVEVPRSASAPHAVKKEPEILMFYGRANGKCDLYNYYEIKNAFLFRESIADKVRLFREMRINKIEVEDTPCLLRENPKIVLHLLPLSAFDGKQTYPIEQYYRDHDVLPVISDGSRKDSKRNLDGILHFCGPEKGDKSNSYVQLYRNGIIEGVDASTILLNGESWIIPGRGYEERLIKALRHYLSCIQKLGIQPPVYVAISLLGVKDAKMGLSEHYNYYNQSLHNQIDRDRLILPEIEVTDLNTKSEELLKDSFDMVWNACGLEKSDNYDDYGKWKHNNK